MTVYIVEGTYTDEPQITGDLVLAKSREAAAEMVMNVRNATCGGVWRHECTSTIKEQMKRLQHIARLSKEEVQAGWEETKAELGYDPEEDAVEA